MPGLMPVPAARSGRCPASFAKHGEISVAAPNPRARKTNHYCCGNHEQLAAGAHYMHDAPISKTLIEFDSVNFEENSPHNRVYFSQKSRFNANDSFKAIC